MKKTILLVLLLLACMCLVLVACDGNQQGDGPADTTQQTTTNEEKTTVSETQTEPHVCAFGDWAMVKEATCTENGEQTRTCACGESETQPVEALGHNEVTDEAIAPTCIEAGLSEGKHCAICNEVLVAQETVAALGHDEVVDKKVQPTCSEVGLTEGKHCLVCGMIIVKQQTIPATGEHSGQGRCSDCGLDYYNELAKIIKKFGYRNEYGTMVYEYVSNGATKVTFYYTSSGGIQANVMTTNSNGTYNFYLKMSNALGRYEYSGSSWFKSYGIMCNTSGTLMASSNSKYHASLNVSNSYKEHLLSGTTNNLTSAELDACVDLDSSAMCVVLQKMDELLKANSEIDMTHFGFQ